MNAFLVEGFWGLQLPGYFDPTSLPSKHTTLSWSVLLLLVSSFCVKEISGNPNRVMNAFLAEGFLGLQLPGDFDPLQI